MWGLGTPINSTNNLLVFYHLNSSLQYILLLEVCFIDIMAMRIWGGYLPSGIIIFQFGGTSPSIIFWFNSVHP